MCPTLSFIGFWENDADVSMFWVRPVECSLKHVTPWDAAGAVRMMCLLRDQHRFFGERTAGYLTKNSTWPNVRYSKYTMNHFAFILCNFNWVEIEHSCALKILCSREVTPLFIDPLYWHMILVFLHRIQKNHFMCIIVSIWITMVIKLSPILSNKALCLSHPTIKTKSELLMADKQLRKK